MTKEQTIEKLKALYTNAVAAMLKADACGDDESSKVMTEYAETLDSAITALTALQTDGEEQDGFTKWAKSVADSYRQTVQTDRDCISRQAAIRIASGYCHPANVAKELAKLPSAQPEWNNHTVACLLAELFDDTCACNYNGIDECLIPARILLGLPVGNSI